MNGWTNKETWLVNEWMGDAFLQFAKNGQEITEDFIRQEVGYEMDGLQTHESLVSDLLTHVLHSVDYRQLAWAYVADAEMAGYLTNDDKNEGDDDVNL